MKVGRDREGVGHRGGPGVDIIERLACHQSAPVVLLAWRVSGSNNGDSADAARPAALVNAKTREMMDGC